MNKFEKVRQKFPCLKTCAYLDSSSIGLLSIDNYESIQKHLMDRMYQGMTGNEYLENWNFAENLRPQIAEMIHGDSDGVFFGSNSSDIINVLTTGLEVRGKNVVTSGFAFPSLNYSWMNQAGHGLDVRMIQPMDGGITMNMIERAVDENTIAIAVPMVEHATGYRYDMEELGDYCNKHDIFFATDTTQSMGVMQIDVERMHIDFMAASTYKWMTNVFGLGVGYAGEKLRSRLKQQYAGWASTVNRTNHINPELVFEKGARRYELGGLNWPGLKSLEQSVLLYLKLGGKEIEDYVLELTGYLKTKIKDVENVEMLFDYPKYSQSQIHFLRFPEQWKLTTELLQQKGIRVNVNSKNTLRAGIHYFNNKKDIDKLIDVLNQYNM